MVKRKRKDCPIPRCGRTRLLQLSNHLASVHLLNPEERKPWLEKARVMNIISIPPKDDLVVNQLLYSMDLRFKSPTSLIAYGATSSGKTSWTEKLLRCVDDMFDKPIRRIVYCYGEFQPRFLKMENEIPNIKFVEGFPEDIYNLFDQTPGLLVLDDLMNESMKNDAMVELITRGSHHRHINTITLVQNLFPPGKFSRTMSLNTHYIVAFKNPRDSLGVSTLAKQAFPGEVSRVMEAYEDATKQPSGYMLFDLHPTTSNAYRLRTSIFPGEQQVAYLKRI